MVEYIKRYNKFSVLLSLALIILSIFLISKPLESLNFIMMLVGIVLIISGLIQIFLYIKSPKEQKTFSLKLILGTAIIILGIIIIVNASAINGILTGVIGAWIILQSILKIQIAFNIKSVENNNWKKLIIISIITLLLGILIIFNPFSAIEAIGITAGIILLINEILNLIESFFILKL